MKKSNNSILRKGLQLSFLVYIIFVSLGHTFNWSLGENLHGICPFGAIETFFTAITTGTFIKHTGVGNYFVLGGLLLTLIVGGAFFCGWICPFGTVQEYIGKIGKKIFKDRYNKMPKKLDYYLKFFKYIFLVFILFQTARQYTLVFENLDPYYTLFNIWSDEIVMSAYIVLAIILSLSLYIERPYCKYICPLGAINGIFNKLSITTIKRESENCISCGMCDDVCPVNIEVSKLDKVNSTKCIRCMKCVDACPVNFKKDTLIVQAINKKKIPVKLYFLIGLVLFIFPIIFGVVTGNMREEEEKDFVTANDIKGSYTIKEVIKNFSISKDEFILAFNLGEDFKISSQIKSLSDENISSETIRVIIGGLDKNIKETIKEIPNDVDGNLTLREVINKKEAGYVLQFFEKESLEESSIDIRRKTMLVDIKNTINDYDKFLEHFKISKEEKENTTLKELIDKYKLDMTEIKDYVNENLK